MPGGPVVKTPCSQSWGPGFDCWSGSQIFPHAITKTQKKKKKKKPLTMSAVLVIFQSYCAPCSPTSFLIAVSNEVVIFSTSGPLHMLFPIPGLLFSPLFFLANSYSSFLHSLSTHPDQVKPFILLASTCWCLAFSEQCLFPLSWLVFFFLTNSSKKSLISH